MDHQSVGLIARGIEEGGIPTVYLGSCRDMMALLRAPRSVFLDFPLGRECGRPNATKEQLSILKEALQVLVTAKVPGEIFDLPYAWDKPFGWFEYMRGMAEMMKEEGITAQEWIPKE